MTDAERAELGRLRQLEVAEHASSLAGIAEQAWAAVRKPGDGMWVGLPMEIKYKLEHLAEKYAAGRAEAEGDYAPEGFYEAVRSQVVFSPRGTPEVVRATTPRRDAFGRKENREDVTVERRVAKTDRRARYPKADADFMAAINTRPNILQGADVSVGDPIVDLDSRSPMEPRGLSHSEDIPEQPNPPVDEDPPNVLAPTQGPLYAKLRKSLSRGDHIDGIGPATAEKIQERLAANE